MIKSQVRSLIQQFMDDPDAKRWSADNLDLLTQMVADEMWADILDRNPWYTVARGEDVTPTSPGYYDVTGLTNRLHNLLYVTRNDRAYSKADPKSVVIQDDELVSYTDYTWTFFGDELWFFPLSTTADVELTYNWKPPAYDDLADGATVVWPDGHELALIYSVAGTALAKGAAEDPSNLLALAERSRHKMFAYIRRDMEPKQVKGADSPRDWGSK